MAYRPGLRFAVTDAAGNVVKTITATVYEPDGTTLLAQAMYDADAGGSLLPNPLEPDALGYVQAFVDVPQRVVVKYGGIAYPYEFSTDPTVTYDGRYPGSPHINVTTQGLATDGSDNHAAHQALLNSVPDGTTLYYPPGVYTHASAITLSGKHQISLELAPGAVIKQTTAGQAGLILDGGASRVLISGGSLVGPGTNAEAAYAAATETGIRCLSGSRLTIRDVDISGFGYRGMFLNADRVRVLHCDVQGMEPITSNSGSSGISISGGEGLVDGCRVSGYGIGINAATTINNKVVNNRVYAPAAPNGLDIGIYCSSRFLDVSHNFSSGGFKCSYSADHSIIQGNICTGKNFWITSGYGGNISNNVVVDCPFSLGTDNSDGSGAGPDDALRCYGVTFANNVIRRSPYGNNGSSANPTGQPLAFGAINGTARDCLFVGNVVEYAGALGMRLYDEQGRPCVGNQILNNTFRKVSNASSGDYPAIALGSSTFGAPTSEDVSGTRIVGNRVVSSLAFTAGTAVTTAGSYVVYLTGPAALADMDQFRGGDLVSDGHVLPAPAVYIADGTRVEHIESLAFRPGFAACPAIYLDTPALRTGTISPSLTRLPMRASYGLDTSLCKAGSTIEVWGNDWGSPQFGNYRVGAWGTTFGTPTVAVLGQTPTGPLTAAASSDTHLAVSTWTPVAGASLALGLGNWALVATFDFEVLAGDIGLLMGGIFVVTPSTSGNATILTDPTDYACLYAQTNNQRATVAQHYVVKVTDASAVIQLRAQKLAGGGNSHAFATTTKIIAWPV